MVLVIKSLPFNGAKPLKMFFYMYTYNILLRKQGIRDVNGITKRFDIFKSACIIIITKRGSTCER